MTLRLGIDLWDKLDVIVTFNENNSIINEKLQKIIGEFCKNHLTNTLNQKRLFDKFRNENDALKKSEFSFSSSAYFLTEQIVEIINAQETFCDALINEVNEIVKAKMANIRKDSKNIKNEKKRLIDELSKENQKLDSDFKRYRQRFNAKEFAYLESVKAEENKALSRNQVDNYQSIYLSRKTEYNEARTEYKKSLENFNNYQLKYYSCLLGEWGTKVKNIEKERYNVMKATFTNLSELCKSIASKFIEIAEKIESQTDIIECEKDCLTLINQEKTGDVPPGDVPFKDFDIKEKADFIDDARISTNSGSDSTSSNNENKKFSIAKIQKATRSLCRSSTTETSNEDGAILNGFTTGGNKLFSKLFGPSKKSKELSTLDIQSKNQNLESLIEEKLVHTNDTERTDECDHTFDVKIDNTESLKNDYNAIKVTDSKKRMSLFRTIRQHSHNKSFDDSVNTGIHKSRSIFKKAGRSISNPFDKRSKSISGLGVSKSESIKEAEEPNIQTREKKPKIFLERKSSKPKIGQKPNARSQTMSYNNKERPETEGRHSLTIEALLPISPVEIVSTPAEAMAIVARSSLLLSSSPTKHDTLSDIKEDSISNIENIIPETNVTRYEYYYIGSCVALHDYESTDTSKMFLSFTVGQQFYIIKEDSLIENSGWLLVETLDRSQSGYVPTSYMDTRQFDTSVLMVSDHQVII